ncbi:MAG: hypothetical protein KKB37_03025 [Alphaproteobacteria bacterium]|nr:hypothetical protein [Alphaproteobacteria bacterium]
MRMLVLALFFSLNFWLPPTLTTARADAAVLTPATLKTMLEGMGFKTLDGKFSNGQPYTQMNVPKGNWQYEILANANNSEILFFSVDFGIYQGKPEDIPQSVLLGYLTENRKLNFVRFVYLADVNKFRLIASLRNRDIKPIDMRTVLSEMVDTADATQYLWDPKNWPEMTKGGGDVTVQPATASGENQAAK